MQAVTGMVYSNASPTWPSNGNGNAFVFPMRSTCRKTDLLVTIWDGSESMEEANPIGKVEISLESLKKIVSSSQGDPDFLPSPVEYSVDLVPRLAAIAEGGQPATLSIISARAEPEFSQEGGKEGAVTDLLRRLQVRRRRDRLNRLVQWNSIYSGHGAGRTRKGGSDYSLVALLTSENSPKNVDDGWSPPDPPPLSVSKGTAVLSPPVLPTATTAGEPLENVVERLAQTAGGGRPIAAPLRAQAALLSRLRPVQFEDGAMILAAGAGPASFFFIRSGHCAVYLRGTPVSRLGPGQFLGEIGLLFGERRLADVRADGPCSLFELDGEDLWLALDMFPGLFTELKRLAAARYERVRGQQPDGPPANAPGSGPIEDGSGSGIGFMVPEGPLREFQLFLQDVASHIHCAADSQGGASRAAKGQASPSCEGAGGGRRADDRLHSISEGEDEHFTAQAPPAALVADAEALLATEQRLAARLERMERAGAFGPAHSERGMGVPGALPVANGCEYRSLGGEADGRYDLPSSLRAAVIPLVGSLEYARRRHGPPDSEPAAGLSPPFHDGWARSSCGSDSEEDALAALDSLTAGARRPAEVRQRVPCPGPCPRGPLSRAAAVAQGRDPAAEEEGSGGPSASTSSRLVGQHSGSALPHARPAS
jgi:hypothetical protein